ncbi:MAG: PQQ-binding-like beta-propeller repeat protein [bacterium]|nr:PQQ-binding-like beta-propeller repeat protein [bacterium]
MKIKVAIALWSALVTTVTAVTAAPPAQGAAQAIPSVSSTRGVRALALDGKVHTLGAGARPFALVFLDTTCPIANRYVPRLNELLAIARELDVELDGVISDPSVTSVAAREHRAEYELALTVLFNASGNLAQRLGPTHVPEAFVVDVEDRLVYRGRIDDHYESVGKLKTTFSQQEGDDWPQWRGPGRDGTWSEEGVLASFPEDGPKVRWRTKIASGYTGPTVADGRVYVMDRSEEPSEIERVLCFDWKTGASVWSHTYDCVYEKVRYEAGPRCAVLVEDGRAYSLGSMGHLFCFDAAKGDVLWSHALNEAYGIRMPIWGIAASPLLEDGLLIVPVSGAEGAYLVAFDAKTGEERWKAFDDRGNYAAPIVVTQAGQRVVVCWTGDRILGVAPKTGKLLWEHPFAASKMPLGVATPVMHGDELFVTGFYDGCVLLRLAQDELAVEEVWRRKGQNERSTDGLHSIISTPLILGEHIYGVDSYGELRCLKLADGSRVWEDRTAVPRARWANIHFVQNGETTWMFNERGELVIARLSPEGFEEKDRVKLIEPTLAQLNQREGVCWAHPAFAYRHVFLRNDEELVCVDLTEK